MADLPRNRTLAIIAGILALLVVLGYATWDQLAALMTALAGVV